MSSLGFTKITIKIIEDVYLLPKTWRQVKQKHTESEPHSDSTFIYNPKLR